MKGRLTIPAGNRHRKYSNIEMTRTFILLAIFLIAGIMQPDAKSADIRLATWNIEHLAEKQGTGCKPRQSEDYLQLQNILLQSDADIIAFQEVENTQAATRVFDPAIYWIETSNRPATRNPPSCRGRSKATLTELRTGFAIKQTALRTLNLSYERLRDLRALGIDGSRWGTQIALRGSDKGSRPIRLLSVHLKAGCAYKRLDRAPRSYACKVLLRQRGILEAWIDERAEANEPFVILGDFNRQLDQPSDHFWQEIDDSRTCKRRNHRTLGSVCIQGSEQINPLADLLLANSGRPYPFPRNPRYPYAIDHVVLESVSAKRLVDDSSQTDNGMISSR